jgi:hypothetical protein
VLRRVVGRISDEGLWVDDEPGLALCPDDVACVQVGRQHQLCLPKTPFSYFHQTVTLLHFISLVNSTQFHRFVFLNVADFKGIRAGWRFR